jgi:hypothetical protein
MKATMKALPLIFISFALAAPAIAQTPPAPGVQRTLLVGDARLTNMISGEQTSERVILVRDVDARSITEIACVKPQLEPALVSPVYLRIQGQNVALSDTPSGPSKQVSGTGQAWGKAGAWSRLHFSMTFTSPRGSVRIEDDNYVLPGIVIARKVVALPDGRPVQLWEIEMKPAAANGFWKEWAQLGCSPL